GKYIKPDNGLIDLIIEAGKEENSSKPYFLILDEMNLSHVERYFADFLSTMESDERLMLRPEDLEWKDDVPPSVSLPPNLFIVGTVNVDETTYMFSPKVLDRANVIEFKASEEDMGEFLEENPRNPDMKRLKGAGSHMGSDFVGNAIAEYTGFAGSEELRAILMKFFRHLQVAGAEFGYRTASEIFRFAAILTMFINETEETTPIDDIADAAVVQKLLPKLHGSRRKLEPVLETLAELCLSEGIDVATYLNTTNAIDFSDREKIRFPISMEKILRMHKRVIQDGFTSFAEA
ncbi:DUF3578 domain-containing protein, partial [Bacteroidota bacterium]